MPNHLSHENSPYLLQHADNPVDWYPWGEAALRKARDEDKPIFLSIGYAACHWCHVMAHESFEDPQTAAVMNRYFVNIKVDREERPDLDSIYMSAVTSLTGQGGWPLSAFLTPDGKPFYGGTYFPPQRRYNMPGFVELLSTIARLWQDDRGQLLESAEKISQHLKDQQPQAWLDSPLDPGTLDEAAGALSRAYDWQHGGWGGAPKFPQPMTIEFLLRRASRGDQDAQALAAHALSTMAKGGMYDVVGGGFARYSTDDRWLVPHFEKMLYDNAQLARAYLQGYLVTGDLSMRRVCEETLDFIARELMTQSGKGDAGISGGFCSSLDADSEGEEGKYYIWTVEEIRDALNDAQDEGRLPSNLAVQDETANGQFWDEMHFPMALDPLAFLLAAYGLTGAPNFEGRFVLQRALDDQMLAQKFELERIGLDASDVPDLLSALHRRLRAVRDRRIRPATDDKVLTAWNALALIAFAEAARYLKRENYLQIARRNADFLLAELNPHGRLLRSWRNGSAQHDAYLEDHAALILALLALYQSDPDPYWFNSAQALVQEMVANFSDPDGGFFDTRADSNPLLLRPKDIQDNATPSGSALAVQALLEMSAYTGDGSLRDLAERALRSVVPYLSRYPTAFARWLCALDYALHPLQEVAVLGDPDDPATQALVDVVWSRFRPQVVLAISPFPVSGNAPALLHDRPLLNDLPTAYVCENFSCKRPVTEPGELEKLMI